MLQPRLVVHLQKTKEFDSVFDNFEILFRKAKEEHADIGDCDSDKGDDKEVKEEKAEAKVVEAA